MYASRIAHTDAFQSNISGTTVVDGATVPVAHPQHHRAGAGRDSDRPHLGPGHYFLGADNQGRDVMARLLYGGRNSLLIGLTSTLICCLLALTIGVVAGYFGGPLDAVLSRFLDVLWSVPVYLLAICLSVVLLSGGLSVGPVHLRAGSLWLPILHHRRRLRALRGPADPRAGDRPAQR